MFTPHVLTWLQILNLWPSAHMPVGAFCKKVERTQQCCCVGLDSHHTTLTCTLLGVHAIPQ
jgi:hypothetical protein